ncbi:hypothetical protein ACHAQA_001218 [Verticillium albo-atrum]
MVVTWDPDLSQDDRDTYLDDVRKFLDDPLTTRLAISSGSNFHNARKPIVKPANEDWGRGVQPSESDEPIQPDVPKIPSQLELELPQRLEIARSVQQKIRTEAEEVARQHSADPAAIEWTH